MGRRRTGAGFRAAAPAADGEADHRIRGCPSGCVLAAAGRQYRFDSGGLAAVRPAIGAGGFGFRRGRCRRRLSHRRPGGGREADAGGRDPATDSGGRARPGRTRRVLRSACDRRQMSVIRLGAVEYLNARPLVHGLEARSDLFSIQYDVPARVASLLHSGRIDLALIPSIEYLRGTHYRVVPDIAVASDGPVASVALFTTRPPTAVRSIAVDASSRTAAALLRILCAQSFDIEPQLHAMPPDLPTMLKRCDAALLIGDVALFTEHETVVDLDKIDLGEEWMALANLPFIWAFWAGRPDVVTPAHIDALREARAAGLAALDEIVSAHGPKDEEQAEIARAYLQENVQFAMNEEGRAGLKRFYAEAVDLDLVPETHAVRYFES
ncbi:MAG: menaquinone biosynthesis protein [Acidobacteria bacterium]|nr:menaquinone biosynthesis protein [Acidobacteriota bacterium]